MKYLTNYKNRQKAFMEGLSNIIHSSADRKAAGMNPLSGVGDVTKQFFEGLQEDFMQEYNARVSLPGVVVYNRAMGVIARLEGDREKITADTIFNGMINDQEFDEAEVKILRTIFDKIAKILEWQ